MIAVTGTRIAATGTSLFLGGTVAAAGSIDESTQVSLGLVLAGFGFALAVLGPLVWKLSQRLTAIEHRLTRSEEANQENREHLTNLQRLQTESIQSTQQSINQLINAIQSSNHA